MLRTNLAVIMSLACCSTVLALYGSDRDEALDSVMKLRCIRNESQHEHVGTAFLVKDQRTIVTALHVVTDCRKITAIMPSGDVRRSSVTIIATDPKHDLALLRLDESVSGTPLIVTDEIQAGAAHRALGYPRGITKPDSTAVSTRDVSRFRDFTYDYIVEAVRNLPFIDINERFINLDANLDYGISGGPIIDGGGRVIGVVLGGTPTPRGRRVWAATGTSVQELIVSRSSPKLPKYRPRPTDPRTPFSDHMASIPSISEYEYRDTVSITDWIEAAKDLRHNQKLAPYVVGPKMITEFAHRMEREFPDFSLDGLYVDIFENRDNHAVLCIPVRWTVRRLSDTTLLVFRPFKDSKVQLYAATAATMRAQFLINENKWATGPAGQRQAFGEAFDKAMGEDLIGNATCINFRDQKVCPGWKPDDWPEEFRAFEDWNEKLFVKRTPCWLVRRDLNIQPPPVERYSLVGRAQRRGTVVMNVAVVKTEPIKLKDAVDRENWVHAAFAAFLTTFRH